MSTSATITDLWEPSTRPKPGRSPTQTEHSRRGTPLPGFIFDRSHSMTPHGPIGVAGAVDSAGWSAACGATSLTPWTSGSTRAHPYGAGDQPFSATFRHGWTGA